MNRDVTRFDATGADAAVSLTRAVTHQRIGMSMAFPRGQIESARLLRALELTLDAEPYLRCRFCTEGRNPAWIRLPQVDGSALLEVHGSSDAEEDMRRFQSVEVPDAGPQVAAALFRTDSQDVLGIKLSHILADGRAAKHFAYLLADTYSRLGRDPEFVPAPNVRRRPSGRDVWDALTRDQRRNARKAQSWVRPTWPAPAAEGGDLTYRTVAIEPSIFGRLKARGKDLGCTVNDAMLAVVLRACISRLDPPSGVPLSLMCTADLRRYLPDAESLPIANISISGSLDIERVDGEGFDQTALRVHESMQRWASACHGAGPAYAAERLAALGYRSTGRLLGMAFRGAGGSGKTYPWFTNIGVIDDERLRFDGAAPESAFMFGPASKGLSIVPAISTYRDTLTVCMGYGDNAANAGLVADILRGIESEAGAAAV